MIVAGIGCKRGAAARDIETAVRRALERANVAAHQLDVIATVAAKSDEDGIRAAAANLGVPVVVVSAPDLETANGRTSTRSERSLAATGVPSVAEAAALAAAGPSAHLLSARIIVGAATCALAASELIREMSA
jgi:cobalt-precorrin 5A hydrolase